MADPKLQDEPTRGIALLAITRYDTMNARSQGSMLAHSVNDNDPKGAKMAGESAKKVSKTATSKRRVSTKKAQPASSSKVAPKGEPKALVKRASSKMQAAQRRAHDLLALIRRRLTSIAEEFYDVGDALRDLSRPLMFGALGYATFEELLTREKLMGRSAAYELIRISEHFTREQALVLGQEKAHAIIQYAAATKQDDSAQELVKGGKIEGKPIELLAARDLETLARKRRKVANKPVGDKTEEQSRADKIAKGLQAWLRRQGARDATVVAVRDRNLWWIDCRMAVEQAGKLIE